MSPSLSHSLSLHSLIFRTHSSEQSDDGSDDDDDLPSLTPGERALRLSTLVAPLPLSEWGQRDTPAPAPTSTSASTPIVPPPIPLPARAPKLTTNNYDGASSDESSDGDERVVEGEEGLGEDEGED